MNCNNCGKPLDVLYIETLEGRCLSSRMLNGLRRSRTGWHCECAACGHPVPNDVAEATESAMFTASEEGRKAEAVRMAAPDLLEACKSTLNWIREYHTQQDGTIWDEGLHLLDRDIRAAIAKAEGGQP